MDKISVQERASLRKILIGRGVNVLGLTDDQLRELVDDKSASIQTAVSDAISAEKQQIVSQIITDVRALAHREISDAASIVSGAIDQHVDDLRSLILSRQADTEASIASVQAAAERSVQGLQSRLQSIDALITQRIEAGFGAFKSAIDQVPGAAEKVADMTGLGVIDRRPAFEVFGVRVDDAEGNDTLVDVWNHPDAPAVADDYVFDPSALRWALIAADQACQSIPAIPPNVWLAGDRGTGKTQFASQFAARTGRGLVRINFDRHLERLDFIGSKGLVDGETVWQDGTFLRAFKRPGTVILLDEFGFANPANVANLQALLEPAASVTYDGIRHSRALGVLVFAADNSTGSGDTSGRFRGVQEQNVALLDRFAATVTFEFLPFATEISLIMSRTGVDYGLAFDIVSLLAECRRKTASGDVIDAPSLRQAFALAVAIKAGLKRHDAFNSVVVAKAPAESKSALLAAALAFFPEGS